MPPAPRAHGFRDSSIGDAGRRGQRRTTYDAEAGLPAGPMVPRSWPATCTRTAPSVDWIRTGGDTWSRWCCPKASPPENTTAPVPPRTTTRAPPPAAVSTTGTGSDAGAVEWWLGPPEPLSTAWSATWSGAPVTRRATDQQRMSAITAATRIDQLGPPRVARMDP